MILREYNLGYGLKDLWSKLEYWEIIGLLYASKEWIDQQNANYKEAIKQAEIERKIKSGKINTYFKRK